MGGDGDGVRGPGRSASAGGRAQAPAGWPAGVRPPGAADWERTAVGWLLDECPPDYRGMDVLRRYPVALAWLAEHTVSAEQHACRRALATARADLAGDVPPPAVAEVLEALELRSARLLAVERAVRLVGEALRGRRFAPRL